MNKQPLIQQIIQGMQRSAQPSDYWTTTGLQVEFPELEVAHSIINRSFYHNQSVWQHTMGVIDLLSIKNPVTLLSGLFHDLGKSFVQPISLNIHSRCRSHAEVSAYIAKSKLTEWQASPFLIDRVGRLVLTHMYDIKNALQDKTIRKFIADIGQDNIGNWFALRIADSKSYSQHQQYKKHIIDPFFRIVKKYLDTLPKKDDFPQLSSELNRIVTGKDHEGNDVFLSVEGSE